MLTYFLQIQLLLLTISSGAFGDSLKDELICAVPYFTLSNVGFGQYITEIDDSIESLSFFDQLHSLLMSSFTVNYDIHDDLFVPEFQIAMTDSDDPDDEYDFVFGQFSQINNLAGRLVTYYMPETAGNYIFSIDDADDAAALMVDNDTSHICCQNANLDVGSFPMAFYIPNDSEHSSNPLELYLSEGQPILIILQFINTQGDASFSFSLTLPSGERITDFTDMVGFPTNINCENVHSTITILSQWTETYSSTSTSLNTLYSSPATIETTYYVMTPAPTPTYIESSYFESSSIMPSSSSSFSSLEETSMMTSSIHLSSSSVPPPSSSSVQQASSSSSSLSSTGISSSESFTVPSSTESVLTESAYTSRSSLDLSSLYSSESTIEMVASSGLSSEIVSSLSLTTDTYSSQNPHPSSSHLSNIAPSSSDSSSSHSPDETISSYITFTGTNSASIIESKTATPLSSKSNSYIGNSDSNLGMTDEVTETTSNILDVTITTVLVPWKTDEFHQTTKDTDETILTSLSNDVSFVSSYITLSYSDKDESYIVSSRNTLYNEEVTSDDRIEISNQKTLSGNPWLFSTSDKTTISTSKTQSHIRSNIQVATQSAPSVEISPNSANTMRGISLSCVLFILCSFYISAII